MDNKRKLQRENDQLWKDVCLALWGDKCLVCNQSPVTFHHFVPRGRNGSMVYDEQNGIPLCQRHHYIIHFSASPAEIYRTVQAIRDRKERDWCKYIDRKEKIHKSSFKTIKWLQSENKRLKKLLD